MTVYLVDFENVRSEGLKGVEQLTAEDKVVIFYSKNANSITFDVHALLSKSSAEIETYRILRGGHNSLDFQLSTYLGYLVMENSYKKIVIISRDKGFLFVTNFWDENSDKCNCTIKLCKSIRAEFENIEMENDLEDGLKGKFIERLSGKDGVILSIDGEEISRERNVDNENSDKIISKRELESGYNNKSTVNQERTKTRTYSRPPGPKRTTYSTNIFTKAEPYYRIPNQELTRKSRTWQNDKNKSNEPWKQSASERKPWKPAQQKSKSANPEKNKNTETTVRDVEIELPINRLINKAMEKIVNDTSIVSDDSQNKVETLLQVTQLQKNPQNPTSKNKIFSAAVNLNISDEVKKLVEGKYDDTYVPLLVEAIGMSTGKQHFYKMMVNKVGQEKGLDLYRLIKSQYTNLKKK